MTLLAMLLAVGVWAQTQGTITGVVRDPVGMPVAGAAVRIVAAATAGERQTVTNEQGRYHAPGLLPGIYHVSVTHTGFRVAELLGVELGSGRVREADVALALGATSESITLTDAARLVDAAASSLGGTITGAQLQSLPLNGRDLFELAAQQPGATVAANSVRTMNSGLGTRVSVNGMRSNQNGFQMDGIRINEASGAAPSSAAGVLLGLEGVAELRVLTNAFSAEYGRAAGGVFTAVSRSGSNDFHGSLYEFLRNSAMDARNYFDNPAQAIPPFRRNQFGGLLAGPVRRNKLFFVTNYEGLRESLAQTARSVTMTAAAREGNLPGGRVTVNPAVRPFLAIYPLPTGREFGDGTGEYITATGTRTREDYVAQKVDAQLSERWRVSGRYTWDGGRRAGPDPLSVWTLGSVSRYQFAHSGVQWVASPRTVHEWRLGFSRVWNYERADVSNPDAAKLSFVPGLPLGAIDVTGLTELGGLAQRLQPRRYVVNDYQINYNWMHVSGAHQVTAGAGFDRVQFNQISDNVRSGYFRFTSVANLLTGTPRSFDVMAPGSDTVRGWRQNLYFAFVQDEYRPGRGLSVSAGVRYETYSTPKEVNGKVATLRDPLRDAAATVGGPLFENPSRTNFAPRLAVAWDPFGKGRTVIRAGAGIFFDLLTTRDILIAGTRMPPFYRRAQITNPAFPNGLATVAGATITDSYDAFDYRPSQPYVGQFQLLVEQQLGNNTTLRVGYAGSRGVHLPGHLSNFNIAVPQVLADGRAFFAANAPLRNPRLGQLSIRLTNFDSNYHGLQTGLQTRWGSRVSGQVKYAFGKSIDNNSRAIFQEFLSPDRMPTPLDYRQNRAVSDYDVTHAFAANGSAAVVWGFEVHGTLQLQSGSPYYPSVGFDRARLRAGTADLGQRPDYIGVAGQELTTGNPAQWFNPLAFGLPEAGFYGTLGRNTLRGLGLATANVAVHKILWQRETLRVRIRGEFFNVANRVNFQVPADLFLFDSTGRRVGSAGRIAETATGARQVQVALRLEF